jgi:hypothetical protein
MNRHEFDEIRAEFQAITLIDDDNLLDMARERPYLHSRYLNEYNKEILILHNMKSNLDKLFAKKYKDIKFDTKHAWNTKGEIENQIFGDDEYYNIKVEYDFQKTIVDFYSDAIDIIKSISFDIKNYTEYKMFLMGK